MAHGVLFLGLAYLDLAGVHLTRPPRPKMARGQAGQPVATVFIVVEAQAPRPTPPNQKPAQEPQQTPFDLPVPGPLEAPAEAEPMTAKLPPLPELPSVEPTPVAEAPPPVAPEGRPPATSETAPPVVERPVPPAPSPSDAVPAATEDAGVTRGAEPAEDIHPRYPPSCIRRGQEGQVVLRVEVLAHGRAGRIRVAQSSSYDKLDQAAIDAAREARFIPAQRNGYPVDAWVNIPFVFRLTD